MSGFSPGRFLPPLFLVFLLTSAPNVALGDQAPPAPVSADTLARARALSAKGDLSAARRLLENALAASPRDGKIALALAQTLVQLQEFAAAEDVLRRLVASLPKRPEPHRLLSLTLLRTGRAAEALEEARAALALDAKSPESFFVLGTASNAAGQPAAAIPAFRRVLASRPKDIGALHGLARAYAALEDPQAKDIYERLIAAAPKNALLRLDFVEYLWGADEHDRGNAEMERLLAQTPESPKLRAHYGINLAEQRKFVRAAGELEGALRAGVQDYEVLYFLGEALLECGRFEEAIERFRSAITLAPEKVAARHLLGKVLLREKPGEAVTELERAVEVDPRSAEVRLDLGRAYEAAGNFEKAEAAYRKTLELDPNLNNAHYTLGTLLARQGRREEAREHITLYQTAFEKGQEERHRDISRRAELNRGWTLLRQNKPAEALKQFQRRPDDLEALHGAARALSKLSRHAEAAKTYERALSLAPEDARLKWELQKEQALLRPSRKK